MVPVLKRHVGRGHEQQARGEPDEAGAGEPRSTRERRLEREPPEREEVAAIGRKLFPPAEAELIAELIRRDLPYYDATISRDFVAGMSRFSRDAGILDEDVPYERVVAAQLSQLWRQP